MKDILTRLQSMLDNSGWCELNKKKTGWNFIGVKSSLLDSIESEITDIQIELNKQPKAWTVQFKPEETVEQDKIVNKQVVTTTKVLKPMINVFPTPKTKSTSDEDMLSIV